MIESDDAPREPTRWGDREQRRRDIVDAAKDLIEHDGYLSLNMRDLAAGAGVSPATLYSYFATKEHLFATLYTEAIRESEAAVRPLRETDMGLAELFGRLARVQMTMYGLYGRHFTAWSALRADVDAEEAPFPRELIVDLRAATLEMSRTMWASVRRAAQNDQVEVAPPPLGPALMWSTFNGLAEHLTGERRHLDSFSSDDLIDFAADRLARALTET